MTLLDLTPRVTTTDRLAALPVIVIGAGPVGLAAAANLVERGIDVIVLEAGDRVGDAVLDWGHTRLFSPWRHLVDPASRRILDAAGWTAPIDGGVPNGAALVRDYLAPLAATDALAGRIRLGARVIGVSRLGMDRTRTAGRSSVPFVVRVRASDGEVDDLIARAVIDASGTLRSPNPLGASGLDPIGAPSVADAIVPALPDVLGADRARFAGRRVVVVGAGHSAANTLIALAQLAELDRATVVTWLIRSPSADRVSASPDDGLPGRADLGSRLDRLVADGRVVKVDSFEIERMARADDGGVQLIGARAGIPSTVDADIVVTATGFRPDLGMLAELRLDLDDVVQAPRRLAPLIDPNLHSCGTVEPHGVAVLAHPEAGFFIVGMKSYGRAPTFLLATGYEQVRSVVAWIDGDLTAATRVALELPATGVCSTDLGSGGCC